MNNLKRILAVISLLFLVGCVYNDKKPEKKQIKKPVPVVSLTGRHPKLSALPRIAQVKPASSHTVKIKNTLSWSWPVKGAILRKYGKFSNSILIGGKPNGSVKSAALGKVVYSGPGFKGYGNLIIIRHDANFLSVYAHNDTILVKEGDAVSQNQVIAKMAQNIKSAPQLQFEIRYQGTPVNPLKYLPKR